VICPQLSGLGHSATAQRDAIVSVDETDAYSTQVEVFSGVRNRLTVARLGLKGDES
jgi:uncharacterized protein (DUF1810 family)